MTEQSRKTKHAYALTFECNGKPHSLRDQIGSWLRMLAQRIDGRYALAMRINSNPPLSSDARNDVMLKGVEHMFRLFKQSVIDECKEKVLPDVRPDLFEVK